MCLSDSPRVSVIVPTWNRAANLPRLLAALSCQQPPPGDFEVIVVDNASTDDTAAVLDACGTQTPRLRWIREARPGASHARNAGAAAARGELLAFLDDDVVPAPDWLHSMVAAFDTCADADCVGGRVEPEWPAAPPRWLTSRNYPPLALQLARGGGADYLDARNASSCLITANFGIRRHVFEEVGGFSTHFSRDEDREFNLRLWSCGKRGKYVDAACARAVVQPDRLTKQYHRRWYHVTGANHARMRFREMVDRDGRLTPPAAAPRVLGAPRFLYRLLLDAARRWALEAVRRREAEMFRAECDIRYYLSYIATRRREQA